MKRKLTEREMLSLRDKLVEFSLTLVSDERKFEAFKKNPEALSDWSDMMEDFNKFGMDSSVGGLTAGTPILIQAIQSEIQTAVDAGTSVSKAKDSLQKKIEQTLQQMS